MNLLRKIWNDFKTQPDVWFFYGFLATFTLSVRKVLFFYPINGQFNEYSGIYLYISDLFLLSIAFSWFIAILCNKQSLLSTITTGNVPPREKCSTWNIFRGRRETFFLPLLLIAWSFISISWSANQNLALFRSIKLFEYFILFIYFINQIVPRGTILRNAFKIIISISLIQAILGIWQFILQHSIGLFWLKESLLSPEIAGVAKIILNQERVIRSYGLFPHPNILGGFLLFSIILIVAYRKMFHVEQITTSKLDIKCSTWNNSHCETYKSVKNVPRGTIISFISKAISDNAYFIILTIQIIAIILTFSKSAILGLIIAISYAYWLDIKTFISKLFHVEQFKQKSNSKMFHVEHFGRKLFIILGIIITLLAITKPNINLLLFKSLDERMLYLNVSRGTISQNTLFGVGSGQFVLDMPNHTNQTLSDWQFQPVHNVFLLVWSELGLIGLILLICMLWKMFHVEQSRKNRIAIRLLRGLLLGLIFVMLFDHYLWDIQQGEVLLWLTLAFLTII